MLTSFSDGKSAASETINGIQTVRVDGKVSADAVNKIIPQLKATNPMPASVWIQKDEPHQLVQAKLNQTDNDSVQLTLSDWDKPVTVTKPGGLMTTRPRTAVDPGGDHQPKPPHRDRRAGSLAVLLGALDTYVVITIMVDIMRDVGIPINKHPARHAGHHLVPARLHRRDAAAGPVVRPVRTAAGAAGQPRRVRDRIGGHRAVHRPDNAGHRAGHPGHRERRPAAGHARPGGGPVARAAGPRSSAGSARPRNSAAVLGPLPASPSCWLWATWHVFWINVPLTILAMVMIQFNLPARDRRNERRRRRRRRTAGHRAGSGRHLYNPGPDGQTGPASYGVPLVIAAGGRRRSSSRCRNGCPHPADRTRGVDVVPFLALATSVCAGAALMVTLVNVELFGQP